MQYEDTQKSKERDAQGLNGLIINGHKIVWKQNISAQIKYSLQSEFHISVSNMRKASCTPIIARNPENRNMLTC